MHTFSDIKIALFIPSLRGGGAERSMMLLANGLAERGFHVHLLLLAVEGEYLPQVSAHVRVVNLKSRRAATSLFSLVRYLWAERPEFLISALNYINVLAVLGRFLALEPTRLIVSERTNVSSELENVSKIHRYLMLNLMRAAYCRADAVVAISKGVADDLSKSIELSRERIQVVYNPVVTPMLFKKAKEPLPHPWLGEGEPPVVLGVGRLAPEKDFPTLLRAFARVRVKRLCRLIILGDGKLRSQLALLAKELEIEESVCFPGFTSNPYAWMSRAAVFVLSSAWEGFGNVVVEAMACGAPVICTDCRSGPREILEDGKWGALTPVGEVAGLAKEINICLDSRKRGASILRAYEFSSSRSVDCYIEILSRLGTRRKQVL